MGAYFRKTIKIGPFRITFSKSGISFSFGFPGFRVTRKPNGGKRVTTYIPGSGVGYRKDYK
jgi:hypothetical protein